MVYQRPVLRRHDVLTDHPLSESLRRLQLHEIHGHQALLQPSSGPGLQLERAQRDQIPLSKIGGHFRLGEDR